MLEVEASPNKNWLKKTPWIKHSFTSKCDSQKRLRHSDFGSRVGLRALIDTYYCGFQKKNQKGAMSECTDRCKIV